MRKIFANHIFGEEFAFKIYKEILQLNNRQIT